MLFCFIACTILSACEKKVGDPKLINPDLIKTKPVPYPETISVTVNADGRILLKGKINGVILGALNYGFMATQDRLLKPVWYMFEKNSKPVVETFKFTTN